MDRCNFLRQRSYVHGAELIVRIWRLAGASHANVFHSYSQCLCVPFVARVTSALHLITSFQAWLLFGAGHDQADDLADHCANDQADHFADDFANHPADHFADNLAGHNPDEHSVSGGRQPVGQQVGLHQPVLRCRSAGGGGHPHGLVAHRQVQQDREHPDVHLVS
jgi:hypothetical protein